MSSDKHLNPQFKRAFLAPQFWPTWLFLGFLWLVGQLPPRANQWVGYCFGFLLYWLAPARKRIAQINIDLCFPELTQAQRAQMVRGVIDSCGLSFAESALALWGHGEAMRSRHSISGLEHIHKAQAEGKGVLFLGSHLTTVDVSGLLMAFHAEVDALYRSQPNPLMNYAIIRARSRVNGVIIQRNDTRRLIKNLREGRIVWYAPDQDYGPKHSVFAPFFGVEAATVVATARIAKMSGAAVIPFFCYREPGARFRLQILPALEGFPCGDDLADAARINKIMEDAIRVAPEQYLWVHRRFKTRPPGEPGLYPKKKRRSRRPRL